MADQPARASIVSGYFNPLHQGHLDMIEAARARSGYLIVIVNNDKQQLLKKGRVIQGEDVRARIVGALRAVDDVLIAVDDGPGIEHSLDAVPAAEAESAQRNQISMHYGVGGVEKADSSTRITAEMEAGS